MTAHRLRDDAHRAEAVSGNRGRIIDLGGVARTAIAASAAQGHVKCAAQANISANGHAAHATTPPHGNSGDGVGEVAKTIDDSPRIVGDGHNATRSARTGAAADCIGQPVNPRDRTGHGDAATPAAAAA